MNASPIPLMTTCLALPAVLTALLCGGCSHTEDKGPTYAELVVIYNAELESLDRLESKKRRLIAEYEEKNAPKSDGTAKALAGLLETAKKARDEPAPETPIDPEKALDKAIADSEQLTDDLLQSAAQGLNQETQPVAYSEEFKQQLAELEKEIEAQRARVDRARQARDAAEAK